MKNGEVGHDPERGKRKDASSKHDVSQPVISGKREKEEYSREHQGREQRGGKRWTGRSKSIFRDRKEGLKTGVEETRKGEKSRPGVDRNTSVIASTRESGKKATYLAEKARRKSECRNHQPNSYETKRGRT